MKKNNSLKINFIYNLLYQIFVLLIPFITAPYLSRILKTEGIGIYSYKYSIVYYFMLIVLLGVHNYGNRSIAKSRNDKEQLSKTFFSIYSLQLFNGCLMVILYYIYIYFFNVDNIKISMIMSIFIFSAIFDINWFFFGLEQFKKTVSRNIIIKIISIVLIFVFVREQKDLPKYAIIMSGTTLLSQLVLWTFLKKEIIFVKITFKDIKRHILPNLVLFIPVLAVSLYKIMDKIMLGMMTNMSEVGLYENAEKVITIPFTLITALGTVMLPRMSNIIASNDNQKVEEYIFKSIKFVMFLSIPMAFGLMAIGKEFAILFFGSHFSKSGDLIILLSITLPFLSFANVLRTQYLIPKEKDKEYIVSVILGAIVNLIMNITFIPLFSSIGACFGTIAAEIVVMSYQSFIIRKDVNIKKYLITSIPFLVKSIIMYIIIFPFAFMQIQYYLIVLLQIIIGMFIYFIFNYKYITDELGIKKILKKFIR